MNKNITKVLLIILSVFVAAAFSLAPVDSFAAGKVKNGTAYTCIKSNNTVYCSNNSRIFKVDLNTEKVKVLVGRKHFKITDNLMLKGSYLYYVEMNRSDYVTNSLYRVNTKDFKKRKLATIAGDRYAISGSKIYYKTVIKTKKGKIKYPKRVMNLNGKSKRSTKYSVKMRYKETNTIGYYVWNDYDDDNSDDGKCNFYLATPNGDILLEYDYLIM